MAGGQERVLRRRIKSVQSTKKITKAMELIAASQILARPEPHRRPAGPTATGMARIVLEAMPRATGGRRQAAGDARQDVRERVAVLAIVVADRGLCGPLQLRRVLPGHRAAHGH